jgi:hypothetical protein
VKTELRSASLRALGDGSAGQGSLRRRWRLPARPARLALNLAMDREFIINGDNPILVTGSNGFIGAKVVETLLAYGFTRLRCMFVRRAASIGSTMSSGGDRTSNRSSWSRET